MISRADAYFLSLHAAVCCISHIADMLALYAEYTVGITPFAAAAADKRRQV